LKNSLKGSLNTIPIFSTLSENCGEVTIMTIYVKNTLLQTAISVILPTRLILTGIISVLAAPKVSKGGSFWLGGSFKTL